MAAEFTLDWILDEYSYLFERITIQKSLIQKKFIEFFEKQPKSNGKDFL